MRINTRTESIELTKQEQRTLENSKEILLQLAKHGDGALATAAEEAAEQVGLTLVELREPVAA